MNIHKFLSANAWFMGRMALATVAMLANIGSGSEPAGVAPAVEPKQAEVARFRPYVSLDRETGRLTYAITNISDQPVDVDLETITGNSGGMREDTVGGILTLYDIELDGEAYHTLEKAPDGTPQFSIDEVNGVSDQRDTLSVRMRELVEKKYTPKFRGWVLEPHGDQKRIVTLRPGEGLSRSILLQDQPWYDEVVEMLEATGFTKYRITPHARVFVFDEAGNRHCDRASAGAYNYPMSPREPNDFRLTRYPVPGASFDLELVKKLQAMKTKGAASRLNEPKRQGGAEAAPPSPLE